MSAWLDERYECDGPKLYRNLLEATPPDKRMSDAWFDIHRSGCSLRSSYGKGAPLGEGKLRRKNGHVDALTPMKNHDESMAGSVHQSPARTPLRRGTPYGKGTPRPGKENIHTPQMMAGTPNRIRGTPGKPRLIGQAAFEVTPLQTLLDSKAANVLSGVGGTTDLKGEPVGPANDMAKGMSVCPKHLTSNQLPVKDSREGAAADGSEGPVAMGTDDGEMDKAAAPQGQPQPIGQEHGSKAAQTDGAKATQKPGSSAPGWRAGAKKLTVPVTPPWLKRALRQGVARGMGHKENGGTLRDTMASQKKSRDTKYKLKRLQQGPKAIGQPDGAKGKVVTRAHSGSQPAATVPADPASKGEAVVGLARSIGRMALWHGRPAPVKPSGQRHCTVPKSPKFATGYRSRPIEIATAEPTDTAQGQDKKTVPRARKLNPAILSNKGHGVLGIPAKRKKPVTQPKEFRLHLKERETHWGHKDTVASAAGPAAEKLRPAAPKAVPTKKAICALTVPKSPNFHIAGRRAKENATSAPVPRASEAPATATHKPCPPQAPAKAQRPTAPMRPPIKQEPFPGLQQHLQLFEQRVERTKQQVAEEERKQDALRAFRANPLPPTTHQPEALPKVTLPVTEPSPFELKTDLRGAAAVEAFKRRISQEEEEALRLREFKANQDYDRILIEAPPAIAKGSTPLTEAQDVVLHSSIRATKRSEFDQHIRDLEVQRMVERERQARLEAQRLQEEVKELRKQLVHKAQPMAPMKPPKPLAPSFQPLTEPKTPYFAKAKTHHRGQ